MGRETLTLVGPGVYTFVYTSVFLLTCDINFLSNRTFVALTGLSTFSILAGQQVARSYPRARSSPDLGAHRSLGI